MKSEEKAKELADYYAGETDYKECAAYDAALAMAQWKDEQLEAEKQALIDKACEWLRNNMYEGTCEQMLSKKPYPFMSDYIEEFKQAMKGGNYENNKVQREKN